MRLSITLAALALIVLPAAAQVTQPTPGSVRGFSANLNLGIGAISFDESGFDEEEDETYNGAGFSLGLSYGFNETVEIFADLGGYGIDTETDDDDIEETAAMGHLDLGARFYFRNPTDKLRPFGLLALSGRSLITETETQTFNENGDFDDLTLRQTLSGGGITYGVGLRYFFNPSWALSGQLTNTYGEYTDFKIEAIDGELPDFFDDLEEEEGHFDVTTSRLQLGIVWYPGR